MKILLTGKNGQVGWELQRSLMCLGTVIACDRNEMDLSNPDILRKKIREIQPDIIINAAAYTAVDKAEEEEELATIINGTSVGVIAEEALKLNALLIHYSTDYVFDGTKTEPYTEDDIPNPINAYGRSKLVGEKAIIKSGCDYLILRTTWVYAARGNNFLKTILRLAKELDELSIVCDQYGAPTWARNIADITAHVIADVKKEHKEGTFASGVYHLSATGKTTWYGFASAIIDQAKQRTSAEDIKTQKVLPIATEDYPLPASRPKNSQMDSDSLTARFNLIMPAWNHAMKQSIDELLEAP